MDNLDMNNFSSYRMETHYKWFVWETTKYFCNECGNELGNVLPEKCYFCHRILLRPSDYAQHEFNVIEYKKDIEIQKIIDSCDVNTLIKDAELIGIITAKEVVQCNWQYLTSKNLKNVVMLKRQRELLENHASQLADIAREQADQINDDAIDRINNTTTTSVGVIFPL
jgi:hypothetical protein